jgi:N-acetylmuramoyl-L-alanine amidase
VRELHERLESLGLASSDAPDTFDEGTRAAVEAFQRSRGLPITGVVDHVTWARLVEAGWRLGDRLVYLARPHLRGDDVADLQIRLAQLGFNPGRIDGIFGPLVHHALSDFQRNCGFEPDGTLTRATLNELRRLGAPGAGRRLVTEARDEAGFDEGAAGPVVVCGAAPLADLVASALAESTDVRRLTQSSPEDVARGANDATAALVLSFQEVDSLNVIHLHYWASYRSHSRRGDRLASELASRLARRADAPRVEVTGMALPILRETRMTTLHVECGRLDLPVLSQVGDVIARFVAEVIHRNG